MRTDGVVACAIIKNEPRIGETIASLRAALGSALRKIVVHDTGSEVEAFRDAEAHAISGEFALYERQFDDFSSARNACFGDAALWAARMRASWLFMFSAGAEFSGSWKGGEGQALRHTERVGEFELEKCCTIHASSRHRFEGRTHEVIDLSPITVADLDHCGITVDYSRDFDPEKKRARWLLDVELLANDYSPRGRFYLAQSFDCLGIWNEAFGYYHYRILQGGFELERLQAVCGAVKTAPTAELAKFSATFAPDCADVQLALAEALIRHGHFEDAKRAAILAPLLEQRSVFANMNRDKRCAEILETYK